MMKGRFQWENRGICFDVIYLFICLYIYILFIFIYTHLHIFVYIYLVYLPVIYLGSRDWPAIPPLRDWPSAHLAPHRCQGSTTSASRPCAGGRSADPARSDRPWWLGPGGPQSFFCGFVGVITLMWVNYNGLTVLPKPAIMVSKGNYPREALFQVN